MVRSGPAIEFDPTISDEPPATLDAPWHRARYLLKPNPIQIDRDGRTVSPDRSIGRGRRVT
jgi:hypothetical protein